MLDVYLLDALADKDHGYVFLFSKLCLNRQKKRLSLAHDVC